MAVKEVKKERILKELKSLESIIDRTEDESERALIQTQIDALNALLERGETKKEKLSEKKKEKKRYKKLETPNEKIKLSAFEYKKLTALEKATLKRLKKKESSSTKKTSKKPSVFVKYANKLFSESSLKLLNREEFEPLKRDLIKSNLRIHPRSYISIMFFSVLVVFVLSFLLSIFLLFFSVSPIPPFIKSYDGALGPRAAKVFWSVIVLPIATFVFMFFYPSMERKTLEIKIDNELPFAAINMSAISGSLIDPTDIFKIIASTKEYPSLEKEFNKIINQVNVLGYDLVSALRNSAINSPSKKLADLLNGIATTITSGGSLPEFFEKRAQTLLFEYRLEREKYTKSAETFMDIYISVVIAAPMVLMLLLMLIQISGIGIGLSTSMITLIMILGVTMINILFLTFLHLKQSGGR